MVGGVIGSKETQTDLPLSIVTVFDVEVLLSLSVPCHPSTRQPSLGLAVRLTTVPASY